MYNFYLGVYIGVCGGQKKGVRFLRAEVVGSCEPHNICARNWIQVSWKKSKSSKYWAISPGPEKLLLIGKGNKELSGMKEGNVPILSISNGHMDIYTHT